jgi:7,8-dihydroneopterin aldolase/epimerase/oxygenase
VTDFSATADRIHLEQLEVHANLGVTQEERAQPQPIVINATLWPNLPFDEVHDDIDRAVNYVDISGAVREFIQRREWNLIEAIASELTSHLLQKFPLKAVEIGVRKFVLPDTEYVSVTMQRAAPG